MSFSGIQIQSIAFHGPEREGAVVRFQDGLNVIYGASDTGKSFIIEAIDFMFGAKGHLRTFPNPSDTSKFCWFLGFQKMMWSPSVEA